MQPFVQSLRTTVWGLRNYQDVMQQGSHLWYHFAIETTMADCLLVQLLLELKHRIWLVQRLSN